MSENERSASTTRPPGASVVAMSDQTALDVVGQALPGGAHCSHFPACPHVEIAERILSALSAAGYSVVKTTIDEWEYGFAFTDSVSVSADDYGTFPSAEAARASANFCATGAGDTYRIYRRHPTVVLDGSPWEPVPEGSAE